MIDKNLPEPPENTRSCVYCFKHKRLKGVLIHWPSEDCTKDEITTLSGLKCGSFSMWSYTCAWCRGIETKRKKRWEDARDSVIVEVTKWKQ